MSEDSGEKQLVECYNQDEGDVITNILHSWATGNGKGLEQIFQVIRQLGTIARSDELTEEKREIARYVADNLAKHRDGMIDVIREAKDELE